MIRGEGQILKNLSGKKNIAQFKQLFETSQYILLEMEYIQGYHLKKILSQRLPLSKSTDEQGLVNQQLFFSEEEASQIGKGILTGLIGIHEKNYVHRDLKLENILIQNA